MAPLERARIALSGRAVPQKRWFLRTFVWRETLRPVILLSASLRLRRTVDRGGEPAAAAAQLVKGWGNRGYAASEALLTTLITEITATAGGVVELGSGASSLVLAAAADRLGTTVVSLEHDERWAGTVRRRLRRLRLPNEFVLHRPLASGPEADWYALQPGDLPSHIGLLICDGPPASTRGGRAGVLPVIESTRPDVVVIDDAERSAEQELLSRIETLGYLAERPSPGSQPLNVVLRRVPHQTASAR